MRNLTNINILRISLIIFSLLLFAECKRTMKDEEILGPEYRPAPEGFSVTTPLTPSNSFPDFISGSIYFTASFSHEVSWTLTITGATSGAEKVITGLSNSLNAANSKWDGGASSQKFFRKGENLEAVLTFLGSDATSTSSFSIQDPKPYNGTVNGIKYTVVEDFETTNSLVNQGFNLGSGFRDINDDPVVNAVSTDLQLQGARVYHFQGMDKNSNGWIAGVTTDSVDSDANAFLGAVDAQDFYINLYVYGTGKTNTSVQIKTYEVDDMASFNFADDYDQTTNDGWVYDIVVDWTGWKLVSIRYSNFKRAADPLLGGNGNGIRQPSNITGFALGLNSYPTSGYDVEAYVDLLVVTQGGPFKP